LGVSTERLSHSFWRRPIFVQKISRQDRLGATIANAVDRQHALFSPSSSVYAFLSPRCFAHRFAAHLDAVGVVHQTIEDGIG